MQNQYIHRLTELENEAVKIAVTIAKNVAEDPAHGCDLDAAEQFESLLEKLQHPEIKLK